MQPMIGRDAVVTLINHRVGAIRSELRSGNCNMTALNAQLRVLEDIRGQLDLILPVTLNPNLVEIIRI